MSGGRVGPGASALLGVAVGDALGVPHEFRTRAQMEERPATGMVGYGSHGQPPGTWSDDTALTLCLAEALVEGYDLARIAAGFVKWYRDGHWTARGTVFDIGLTTATAMHRLASMLEKGAASELPLLRYTGEASENGDGSLMRILPLVFPLRGRSLAEQFPLVWEVSALTHRHIRAAMACQIYLRLAEHLLDGKPKREAYRNTQHDIRQYWEAMKYAPTERQAFARIIAHNITSLAIGDVRSGSYVVDSLEAAVWSFLREETFADTVRSAVNLGGDTDTTAAIAGGLAGLYYGGEAIPENWLTPLARAEEIVALGDRLHAAPRHSL